MGRLFIFSKALFALLCCALVGCASVQEVECRGYDWKSHGRADALAGTPSNIDKHARQCAGYGVTPDNEAYKNGYRDGLTEYCTPEVGRHLGSSRAPYQHICPADLEGAFLVGYDEGRQALERFEQKTAQPATKSANGGRYYAPPMAPSTVLDPRAPGVQRNPYAP